MLSSPIGEKTLIRTRLTMYELWEVVEDLELCSSDQLFDCLVLVITFLLQTQHPLALAFLHQIILRHFPSFPSSHQRYPHLSALLVSSFRLLLSVRRFSESWDIAILLNSLCLYREFLFCVTQAGETDFITLAETLIEDLTADIVAAHGSSSSSSSSSSTSSSSSSDPSILFSFKPFPFCPEQLQSTLSSFFQQSPSQLQQNPQSQSKEQQQLQLELFDTLQKDFLDI